MNTLNPTIDGTPDEEFDPALTPNQVLNIQRDRIAREKYEKVHGPIPKGAEWNGHTTVDQALHSYNLKLMKPVTEAERTKQGRKNGRMSAQEQDRGYGRA